MSSLKRETRKGINLLLKGQLVEGRDGREPKLFKFLQVWFSHQVEWTRTKFKSSIVKTKDPTTHQISSLMGGWKVGNLPVWSFSCLSCSFPFWRQTFVALASSFHFFFLNMDLSPKSRIWLIIMRLPETGDSLGLPQLGSTTNISITKLFSKTPASFSWSVSPSESLIWSGVRPWHLYFLVGIIGVSGVYSKFRILVENLEVMMMRYPFWEHLLNKIMINNLFTP